MNARQRIRSIVHNQSANFAEDNLPNEVEVERTVSAIVGVVLEGLFAINLWAQGDDNEIHWKRVVDRVDDFIEELDPTKP